MRFLHYEEKDFTGTLTVNRPERLNTLTVELLIEFSRFMDELSDANIRVLVLTGAGDKAFIAGADISYMKDISADEARIFCRQGNEVCEKLENFPLPVIAAVNGFALGGGMEIALSCDFIVASRNAVFALPELSLGIMPGFGGIQRLVRLIGAGRAKQLIYSAERIDAEEARRAGIVNSVHEPAAFYGDVQKIAGKIASNAPRGIRASKKIANLCIGIPLHQSTRMELERFAACFGTEDQKNAMSAFVNKTAAPAFTGR
jgi:enoyl-CoA hydratase